ncbi:hypothetical protein IQ270_07005 [Microcoleus sp. LEGE 07076]|uniref:adenylate/guanylate cyclase domain-containing protein n=1 Tax=Microcoleus sp. LEGE 07076 TaxID=915322 RepID=UPI0018807C6C|nr:adenylate/guanylate cyclase domain-containing protein [Microcoleus sp. LEGE 07076]MBE9184474.1 hypothetical protein [Microcoleus sp. LEGE 07076]
MLAVIGNSQLASIQLTSASYEDLREKYFFENRGAIEVKGKGEMTTYLLQCRKWI